jgi:hypothetical protein
MPTSEHTCCAGSGPHGPQPNRVLAIIGTAYSGDPPETAPELVDFVLNLRTDAWTGVKIRRLRLVSQATMADSRCRWPTATLRPNSRLSNPIWQRSWQASRAHGAPVRSVRCSRLRRGPASLKGCRTPLRKYAVRRSPENRNRCRRRLLRSLRPQKRKSELGRSTPNPVKPTSRRCPWCGRSRAADSKI